MYASLVDSLVHCIWLKEAILALFVHRQVTVCVCEPSRVGSSRMRDTPGKRYYSTVHTLVFFFFFCSFVFISFGFGLLTSSACHYVCLHARSLNRFDSCKWNSKSVAFVNYVYTRASSISVNLFKSLHCEIIISLKLSTSLCIVCSGSPSPSMQPLALWVLVPSASQFHSISLVHCYTSNDFDSGSPPIKSPVIENHSFLFRVCHCRVFGFGFSFGAWTRQLVPFRLFVILGISIIWCASLDRFGDEAPHMECDAIDFGLFVFSLIFID